MNASNPKPKRGFSLMETVIAIAVVAVLLSGFLVVFAPAAAGIKESINSKAAARLVNTLEQELVSLRGLAQSTEFGTGFNKAYAYIRDSSGANADDALLVYKYRASLTSSNRTDGTPDPVANADNLIAGEDFVVRNMMRRKGDPEFLNDLPAIEGQVYMVKCTQLILSDTGQLEPATPGQLANASAPDTAVADPDNYEHAVIAFVADFYTLPARGEAFFDSQFSNVFANATRPAFSRNLAVRR
ncbi:MAG: prepilin-type N-terminal cleavage/methylation domain-containing protein [Akkermansiaceae bacterium]|nr:prepilin-type N-terminal cleavage/methylation domain-containing protein [Akkermansiaceae bacterium]